MGQMLFPFDSCTVETYSAVTFPILDDDSQVPGQYILEKFMEVGIPCVIQRLIHYYACGQLCRYS